jgi:VIT1/CCC1 family predicted Fe2+/Mn2+ transporter
MPASQHLEKHFTGSDAVRDIVIGMSDGLTVPFALAAGLCGAATPTSIILTAGLAEIAAGSIAMGLGGYLAGKTESDHYAAERQREVEETVTLPETEADEVAEVFRAYQLPEEQIKSIVTCIRSDRKRWVDFMMRFELGLTEPDPRRALRSAVTIAASYVVGGLIPLMPYVWMKSSREALWVSVAVTLAALFSFGAVKGHYTQINRIRGGLQTTLIGGLAATAAFILARLMS